MAVRTRKTNSARFVSNPVFAWVIVLLKYLVLFVNGAKPAQNVAFGLLLQSVFVFGFVPAKLSNVDDLLTEIVPILTELENFELNWSSKTENEIVNKLIGFRDGVNETLNFYETLSIKGPFSQEALNLTREKYENITLHLKNRFEMIMETISSRNKSLLGIGEIIDNRVLEIRNTFNEVLNALNEKFDELKTERLAFKEGKIQSCLEAIRNGNIRLAVDKWNELTLEEDISRQTDLIRIIETAYENGTSIILIIQLGDFFKYLAERLTLLEIIVNLKNLEQDQNYLVVLEFLKIAVTSYIKSENYPTFNQGFKNILDRTKLEVFKKLEEIEKAARLNIQECMAAIKLGNIDSAIKNWYKMSENERSTTVRKDFPTLFNSAYESGTDFSSLFQFVDNFRFLIEKIIGFFNLVNLENLNKELDYSEILNKLSIRASSFLKPEIYSTIPNNIKNLVEKLKSTIEDKIEVNKILTGITEKVVELKEVNKIENCIEAIKNGSFQLAANWWKVILKSTNNSQLKEIIERAYDRNESNFDSVYQFVKQIQPSFPALEFLINSMNPENDSRYFENLSKIEDDTFFKIFQSLDMNDIAKKIIHRITSKIDLTIKRFIEKCIDYIKNGQIQLAVDRWNRIGKSYDYRETNNSLLRAIDAPKKKYRFLLIRQIIKTAYENENYQNVTYRFINELRKFDELAGAFDIFSSSMERNKNELHSKIKSEMASRIELIMNAEGYRDIDKTYKNIFIRLRYNLPNLFCLKNVSTKRYLIAADSRSGFKQTDYNVFMAKAKVRQGIWNFESTEDSVSVVIRNTIGGQYLFASSIKYNAKRRMVLCTFLVKQDLPENYKWLIRKVGESEIELINVSFNQSLYASKINYLDKGLVFTWVPSQSQINSRWTIENCE